MQTKQATRVREVARKEVVEMADSHCHLDLVQDWSSVLDSIRAGVSTIITDSVDTKSIMKTFAIVDKKHIFGAVGIDPEHAISMVDDSFDEELEFVVRLAMEHAEGIVAIGEIGLDYKIAGSLENTAKQRTVFSRFLDVASDLRLPASIHARGSMEDVLKILEEKGFEKAHLHFFDGDVEQAKEAEKRGYMISIPPVESSKRRRVVRAISIDNIMAESDSPVVGSSPRSVEDSIRLVAEAKGMEFKDVADILTDNTKRILDIHAADGSRLMRY